MDKKEFNEYSADVMGHTVSKEVIPQSGVAIRQRNTPDGGMRYSEYSPYDDLNQMAKVFDKLFQMKQPKSLQMTQSANQFKVNLAEHGIEKAMRDFIKSTKDKE